MTEFLVSLVPSLGAIFLLWVGLRAIIQADRRERSAMARFDAEHARSQATQGGGAAGGTSGDGSPAGSAAAMGSATAMGRPRSSGEPESVD